ncbi:MAG TPA: TonB-dependent receptor [Woeseiaceae bacterium]|nr:TonB-dependent receptor [Woeseiaceae bacterium]
MRVDDERAFVARIPAIVISLAALLLAAVPVSFAQEADEDAGSPPEAAEVDDEVVVTGSRLRRDTYTSVAPLQVITGEVSREVGLIDATDILQESTASSGQQIDLTFTGFVLDNGPGATTVDLRGLGANRTLVLINGRRVAPAGVEGAPVAADISLVPSSLVQQYDLLLDGASSVYGSDAVAGVVNILMRKDFDGLEIEGYWQVPHHDNGLENTFSLVWGKNFDRGFIGVGAEWQDKEAITLDDRPWTAGCEKHAEIDEFGQVRTRDLFNTEVFGMTPTECRQGLLARRVAILDGLAGSVYYTPGFSNGGWPEFSESSLFGVIGVDGDGDGQADVSFHEYDLNGHIQNAHLFPELEQQSVMAYGEYTFGGEANFTPYFEALYARRENFIDFGSIQFFPLVPAGNPFNICNPAADGGVDCGLAWDALMNNPNFINQVMATFGCNPGTGGNCPDQTVGPLGPLDVQPIVSVRDDRNTNTVEVDQFRLVGGFRSDLPFIDFGSFNEWSMDFAGVLSKSTGKSNRLGIRGDRVDYALGWYSTTNTPCENNIGIPLPADDTAAGCVPVNMFAPSLYPEGIVGDFATAAEREYLFDSRDFDTEYEQALFTYYMSGNVFELPAGNVAAGIGFEHRTDEINSIPDEVARDGLFFGFFSDGGAVGEKTTKEAFGEVELPLLANIPAAEELSMNLSARWTDDEFYGSAWTNSYKLGWRPVESLLIRGTYGTSYRAPNLRELFLQDQTGFLNLSDPCLIPDAALDPITDEYVPALDTREEHVLANCLAQGVDPTIAHNNGFNIYSIELAEGGSLDLDEEDSESWSAGFAWEQPFTDAFGLNLSVTYYSIEIENTIIEPNGQFIINDCYENTAGGSAFCDRIERDLSDPTNPLIQFIDQGFINRDNEAARGVDVNLTFDSTFDAFQRPIDLSVDFRANRLLERSTLFIDDNGEQVEEQFKGEWGFPDWKFRNRVRFDMDGWRLTWETSYIASVVEDPLDLDEFGAILGTPTIGDTCLGPPGDVLCRDIGFAEDYFLHHLSLYYYGDVWTFGGGIRNLFDEEPPFVDGDEGTSVLSINNTPIGYGYDLRGRTYFLNVGASFGGG